MNLPFPAIDLTFLYRGSDRGRRPLQKCQSEFPRRADRAYPRLAQPGCYASSVIFWATHHANDLWAGPTREAYDRLSAR